MSESKVGQNAGGALARLSRAVETFGFHLATLDLRQNADVHARVVAELLKVAGVSPDYQALEEPERVLLLRRELASERLLASPYASYSPETLSELGVVRAAAEAHRRYGCGCMTTYIVSKCESVSDLLEVNILLKEAGLYRGQGNPRAAIMAVALFQTLDDFGKSSGAMTARFDLPEVAALTSAPGLQEAIVGYSYFQNHCGFFSAVLRPHPAA